MSRDGWAEPEQRGDLLQSSWRPDEDMADRRTRVITGTLNEIERLDQQLHREHDDLEVLATLVTEKFQLEREIAERRLAAALPRSSKPTKNVERSMQQFDVPEARVCVAEGSSRGGDSRHVEVDPSAWQALGCQARGSSGRP